jgi:hypothetical protein
LPPINASALGRTPSAYSWLDQNGRRHLSYFQSQTAHHLGGYLEDELWSQLVLQVGSTEKCINYVVIALGSLHETFEHNTHRTAKPTPPYPAEDSHIHYARAISHLQEHITSRGWAQLEVTLIACILCTGYEWLRGDIHAAATHLKAGVSILHQWQTGAHHSNSPSFYSPAGHLIRHKLAPFYTRLTLLSGTVLEPTIPWHSPTPTSASTGPFTKLQHARDSLFNLAGEMCLVPSTKLLLSTRSPSSRRRHVHFENLFAQWEENFDLLLTKHPTRSPSERASSIILRLLHISLTVMLRNSYSNSTTGSAAADTVSFERIVTIAGGLFETYISRFTLEFGFVAPMYYVVRNCRRREVRDRALEFVELYPVREGCWNSWGVLAGVAGRGREGWGDG